MQFTTILSLLALATSALAAPAPVDNLKDLKLWSIKDYISTRDPSPVSPRSAEPQGAFAGAQGKCCSKDQSFKINLSCSLLCGAFSGTKVVGSDAFVEGCITSCTSSYYATCGGIICS